MDNNQAAALRDKILAEIQPLMIDGVNDGSDKFDLLMRVIQTGKATNEMFSRAYESAKLIEDKEEKLDALLALLDEIDLNSDQSVEKSSLPVSESEPSVQA
ncbi:MAG: hypothetical protein WCQ49_00055 [Candidatus Saccharibacteria bacterium]